MMEKGWARWVSGVCCLGIDAQRQRGGGGARRGGGGASHGGTPILPSHAMMGVSGHLVDNLDTGDTMDTLASLSP